MLEILFKGISTRFYLPVLKPTGSSAERHRASTSAALKRPQGHPDNLDHSLQTGLIEPGLIRNDAFEGFVQDRARLLLDLIEDATGKPIAR